MKVTKRDGRLEDVDFEKIHKVIIWGSEGLDDVSVSEVEMNSSLQLYNGIKTEEIHDVLIKSAADLTSEETPGYSELAARLAMFQLRKKVYGDFSPKHIYEHLVEKTNLGFYDKDLLIKYSKEEWDFINSILNHNNDMKYAYAAVKQLEGKYLVQNRATQQIHESPQIAYALISAAFFINYPKEIRLKYVERFYNALSNFKIQLPTPVMSGLRTPTKQFSSCVKIEAGDSLDEINATSSAIIKYVSQRAGIGVNAGMIRAVGSPIRGGEAVHTGMIPFIKHFQTAVKSCSQGGVRGGAATLFFPIWHYEVRDLLVLKNNRGVEENRARHLDYGVQINGYFYQKMIKNEDIYLFSPSDVPGLYDAFFANQELFKELYEKYSKDVSIRKSVIPAIELFSIIAQERSQTGRIYIQHVDHCNTHSAFDASIAPVKQSNLCMEITLPTKPLKNIFAPEGEIALCTLSAINVGILKDLSELEELMDLSVRALDELLTYQDYPVLAAEISTKNRRSLGIGVTNYAYFLAKNNVKYSDGSANQITHDLFEAIQYYGLKASCNLAKEKGACGYFSETTYSKGILPIDTYKKTVDELVVPKYNLDWDSLRKDIASFGLRNSTITALMPCETSSQITNSTNGIEPPRGLVSVKASKDGIMKQVVPEIKEIGHQYETLWSMGGNKGYIDLVAIMQKFVDQSISANTNYDPELFEESKVPVKLILKDLAYAYKMGLKTLYYHNTRDHATSSYKDDDCAGGACKI